MASPEPLTPDWWRDRLLAELSRRQADYKKFRAYAENKQAFPGVPRELQDNFRVLVEQSRTNFMRLVIGAPAERMRITGFRLASGNETTSDSDAWDIWQANNLDSESASMIEDGLTVGDVYLVAEPAPQGSPWPVVQWYTAESTIVEHHPARRRDRVAALRTWEDPWTGAETAQLWHAGAIIRWERRRGTWTIVGLDTYPGEIPVVGIHFHRRNDGTGRSEIADVTPIQDRINTSLFNRLLAQWLTAYRQKWATGIEIPKDDEGNDVEPFQSAIDRLWTSESENARFGSFDATSLTDFIAAIEQDALHVAVTTTTPRSYLIPTGQAPSGDAEKAAQIGLVSKVFRRHADVDDGGEEIMRIARLYKGLPDSGFSGELVWADPEFRTEGELIDSLVKQRQTLEVPLPALWERAGYSPQQIRQFEAQVAREAFIRSIAEAQPATTTEIATPLALPTAS